MLIECGEVVTGTEPGLPVKWHILEGLGPNSWTIVGRVVVKVFL
jgi:hypothetical protein